MMPKTPAVISDFRNFIPGPEEDVDYDKVMPMQAGRQPAAAGRQILRYTEGDHARIIRFCA
jgi:hypothetical protein